MREAGGVILSLGDAPGRGMAAKVEDKIEAIIELSPAIAPKSLISHNMTSVNVAQAGYKSLRSPRE